MLRKWGTLVLLFVAIPALALAQNTGKLAGTVIDAATGDPLPGANVVLVGTQMGTITDADGDYFILGVPVGVYDVQSSFVGYRDEVVRSVEINSGYTREINFSLSAGVELDEIVVEYERPIIQRDAIGTPKIVSGEELQNLPVRGVASVAALQGGVVSNEGSNDLFVRGGREQQVTYYVDGVKVLDGMATLGTLGVPGQAIQEQEMLVGSIPARYGDAMSGVINIATKTGGPNFFGSIEAISSEMLDGFGYNLFSGTIGGPVVPRRLSFFLSGQGLLQADANPPAIDIPQLSDAQLASMWANPQVLQVRRADGAIDYVPLPRDIQPGTAEQIHSQLGLGAEDEIINDFSPINAPDVFDPNQIDIVNTSERKSNLYDVSGNLNFTPSQSINVRAGGTFGRSALETFNWARQLYARDKFYNDDDQTWRAYLNFRQNISRSAFYQVQAEYTDNRGWIHPNDWSRDVQDLLYYGDIDHAVNATRASYRTLVTEENDEGETIYSYTRRSGLVDGIISPGAVSPATFVLPGQGLNQYTKHHNQQFRVQAHATTQVGIHQIEFGGEYEQQTRRFFRLLDAAGLSRYFNDDNVEAGAGFGVDRYEDLPYAAFQSAGRFRAEWYGYDFRGLNEVDSQDIDLFTRSTGDANAPDDAFNVAPHQPIYYGGYISDKIEYRDLVLNLGLRVDVFDNNTQVLTDPFAMAPIVRAGDLGTTLPGNVGNDFAVYFSGENVIAYRDLEGNYFDANGQQTTLTAVEALGGRARQVPGTQLFSPEIFSDYEPEVTVMPRIGVSFPVTDQALFFASYNVTSQRPSEFAFEPFTTYEALTGQDRVQNPALKPEKTTQYELGFRQSIGSRAAVQISGFYRKQTDLIQVRALREAFPSGLQTFRNIDFAVTKGAEFEFDLRRTNNVALRANYTLSFAQGTGSDAQSLGVIAWRSSMGGFSPNFISPMDFDRRHSINVVLDYRLGEGEGPMIFGTRALSNFGVNITANVGSGMPYTRLKDQVIFSVVENFTDDVEGAINQARLPWTSLINLRLDRRFDLGPGTALTAFIWVQNLLDTDNVLGVYRASGQAETDLFLNTAEGQRLVRSAGDALGDPRASDAYRYHYAAYVDAPIGFDTSNHFSGGVLRYAQPRRTRIGVRLNF